MTLRNIITLFALCLLSLPAQAGGEKVWELAGYDEFSRGELKQTVLSEKGEILAGLAAEKIDLEAVGLVWSVARANDGTVYLGTAYDGKIYRVDGNKAWLIATTDTPVVTDMTFDKDGALLATTIPEPTVWKIAKPKKIDPKKPQKAVALFRLPADEMIWTLARDAQTNTIYLGTGPEGKIWAAGNDRKPQLYLDTEEKHILDILPVNDGIYAGTSPNALLLKVTAPGVSFAVADFEGTEVKSIAPMSGQRLAAGVNAFTYPRTSPTTQKKSTTSASVSDVLSSAAGTSKSSTKTSSSDKGYVYRVAPSGAFEQLLEKSNTHVTTVVVGRNDTIWTAMGNEGKIISIIDDRTIYEAADLAEREVMCLLAGDALEFAATGDAGAAYRFTSQNTEQVYLSPVLDAKAVSTFGRASWYATGPLKVSARSGNTITPDSNWNEWSKNIVNSTAPQLTKARYAQFRFEWQNQSTALIQFELLFKPDNQRAIISRFDPDTPFRNTSGDSDGEAGTSERTITLRPAGGNSKSLSLSWAIDNPDNDDLQYRLYYKPIDKSLWIPIFKEDERYTKTRYIFDTDQIPEGRYHFKLTATDSIENPHGESLADEAISVPVHIDNHPPEITNLVIDTNKNAGTISGVAKDSFSPIAALDYAVDGGNWLPVAAKDGILDTPKEAFHFKINPPLNKGGHVVAVKATDRGGNFTVSELHTEIKP